MAKTTKKKARNRSVQKAISIEDFDLRDGDSRSAFDRIVSRVDKKFKRVTDPIRDSQRLSKDDFAIRINTRG